MTRRKVKELTLEEQIKLALPKGYKLPKKPAEMADLLFTLKKKREEKARELRPFQESESLLKQWFIKNLPAEQAKGIAGQVGRVEVERIEVPNVFDWEVLRKFIKKNNAWDLLPQSVSAPAVRERWANNKTVPGIKIEGIKKVSITKVKSKK